MSGSAIGIGREKKGTMFLRSNEMHYSRAVLNSKWHQAREGEPRDYDLNHDPVRDLHKSTYCQLGTVGNSLPFESTYTDHFKEKQLPAKEPQTAGEEENESKRDNRRSKYGFVVLPRHNSAKLPHHYLSTHQADFVPHFKMSSSDECRAHKTIHESPAADHTGALKRNLSQFTDTTGPRRSGRNTWQDESGVYCNALLKSACPYYSRTYTLMPGGVKPDAC